MLSSNDPCMTDEMFSRHRQSIFTQADKMRMAIDRHGLTLCAQIGENIFDPAVFTIGAPASESVIDAMDKRLNWTMPSSIRQWFRYGSADMRISWCLPSNPEPDRTGDPSAPPFWSYLKNPPPPFQKARLCAGQQSRVDPILMGGTLALSLESLPDIQNIWHERLAWFQEIYHDREGDGNGLFERAANELWQKCFPIATNRRGDILGVDTADPRERLVLLNGDPGPLAWLLGQSLAEHLDQVSQIGFIGFDSGNYQFFKNEKRSKTMEEAFAARLTGPMPDHMPIGMVIDADCRNGRIWREWLSV